MISSRKSSPAPSILGWAGATVRRMKVGARGLAWRISALRNLVELANARLVVVQLEHGPADHQQRHAQAAPQRRRVWSVEQFGGVDVVVVVAADILLSHETGGAQRRNVFRVDGRE